MPGAWNFAVLAAFVVNILSNVLSSLGALGSTNAEVSNKYEPLIVPAGYAFSIWGLIFFGEAVLCLAQLLPSHCSDPLVSSNRIPLLWVLANLLQSAWLVTFGLEQIALSTVLMVGIWVSLGLLLVAQAKADKEREAEGRSGWKDFLLFRLPIQIHFSWITAACVLNFNILAVKLEASASDQLCIALVSYAVLVFVAAQGKPPAVLPAVLCWALVAIAAKLDHPDPKVLSLFGDVVVEGVRKGSATLAAAAGVLAAIQAIDKLRAASLSQKQLDGGAFVRSMA